MKLDDRMLDSIVPWDEHGKENGSSLLKRHTCHESYVYISQKSDRRRYVSSGSKPHLPLSRSVKCFQPTLWCEKTM